MKLTTLKSKLLLPSLLLFGGVSLNAQLSFSLPSSTQCYSTNVISINVTSTVSGATSYTWSINSPTCNPTYTASSSSSVMPSGNFLLMNFPCGSSMAHTITCYALNGTSTLATLSQTCIVGFGSNNSISVSPSSGGCPGSTFTITNSGSNTYTLNPGNIVGNTAIITPTAFYCYTVTATAASGCTTQAASCLSIAPSPTVTVPANYNACSGHTLGMMASGASSYTWSNGATGAFITITPTASACYTVTGSNSGCPGNSAVTCINLNASPNLGVSGPSSSVCPGTPGSYVAMGVNNTYTWTYTGLTGVGTATGSSATLPVTAGCVSVHAVNFSTGCTADTTWCPPLLPGANISVVPSASYVCEGSGFVYTASGAATFAWSTGANTNTIGVVAGTFGNYTPMVYTVTGTSSGGCVSSKTVTPWQITYTCSTVWPGDANRDGVVDNTDVFELGLWSGSTGVARTGATISWTGQQCTNWGLTSTVSTGWNRAHADCNGDGTVNAADTSAIVANYALTHAFKTSETTANGDINLVATQATEGIWNKADIVLGSSASPINLYGIAFDVTYDNSMVETNSAYIVYTASFLNAANQNIQFRKNDFTNGKTYGASVRINNSNVSGNGKIGEFWFKVKNGLPANSNINLSVAMAKKVVTGGVVTPLTGGTTAVAIVKGGVGVKEALMFDQSLNFYPNPAANALTLQSDNKADVSFMVSDVIGREVARGEFNGTKTIDVSSFQSGTYIVRFASGSHVTYKKLVIE